MKKLQSKHDAMAKEFASELQEMDRDDVGTAYYLQPYK